VLLFTILLAWALAQPAGPAPGAEAGLGAPQHGPLDEAFPGRSPGEITRRLARDPGNINLPDPTSSGGSVFDAGPLGRLTNTVCRSDLVAVGVFERVETYLNADASSIYSEWTFRPGTPLKTRGLELVARSPVSLFMRGGSMRFGERTVRVSNRDFARGLEPGAELLVFAFRLPESGALVATAGFRLDEDAVSRTSARPRYAALEAMDRHALLAAVRDVLARTSDNPDCAGA